jgi:hypothetical protein
VTENQPSYLKEMLTSQGNMYAGLASVAAAVLLSIPFGFGFGAIPLIAFAAGEFIAAMYIPATITFRDAADRRFRARNRTAARNRLLDEIQARDKKRTAFDQTLKTWRKMSERVESLYRHAAETRTNLPIIEIERLDDATIDYLCIWLARLVMEDRAESVNLKEIEQRVAMINRELETARPGVDARQLQKAKEEYFALVERHNRMMSRKTAIEAAMLSMPDQVEEIYQTIMTTPASEDIGSRLEDSIENLRLQEDIEAELSGELEAALPGMVPPLQRTVAKNQQMAKTAGQRS